GVVTKDPTCTEAGVRTRVCTVCGETQEEAIAPLGHDLQDVVGKDATCTEAGWSAHQECSRCDYKTEATPIDPLGHTPVEIPAVPATCTESGLTVGLECSVCDAVIVEPTVVPALGHEYGNWEVLEKATCEHGGVEAHYCLHDGCEESETRTTGKLPHTEEVIPGKDATCTESGLTEGKKCSVCDEIILAQEEIEALGHSWDDGVVTLDPTCSAKGEKVYTCDACGETKKEELAALGHTEEIIPAIPATCTVSGWTEGVKCSVCGEIVTAPVEVPALGHEYGEDHICVRPGCGALDPSMCNHSNLIATPAKDATCLEAGNLAYWTCEGCHKLYKDADATVETTLADVILPALGHAYDDGVVTTEPTCSSTGVKTYTCANCGDTKTENIAIDLSKHSYGEWIDAVEATCSSEGVVAHKDCTLCGKHFDENNQEIANVVVDKNPDNHGETEVRGKVDATCATPGYTGDTYCIACNTKIADGEEVAALGHTFVESVCSACDLTLTDEEVVDLAYGLENGASLNGTFKVTAVVSEIKYAYTANNGASFYIVVDGLEGQPIYVYKSKCDAASVVAVGDEIVIVGSIKNYNGEVEFVDATFTFTDESLVASVLRPLHLPESVMDSFDLPTIEVEGVSLSWSVVTENCTALVVDGNRAVVSRQAEDVAVVLLATATKGEIVKTKEFTVVVLSASTEAPSEVTFTFGDNGEAVHVDGNSLGATKTYTEGAYSLVLESMTSVYGPAFDAKG
ncbi:MAG: hypothetical protein IJX70_02550, partial [Clostridia bacterium]|nr:hypothetical protein [Clostridia bacterium]